MKPRRIGDGILFVSLFALLLIFFYSIGTTAQTGVTEPSEVPREVRTTNVSENGSQVLQLNNVGQGCLRDSIQAWDPQTQNYLEKPWNYTVVSYETCEVNITDYYNSQTSTQDIAFSYIYSPVDSLAVLSIGSFVSLLDVLSSGILPLAFLVIFILFLPRIWRAIREGGGRD